MWLDKQKKTMNQVVRFTGTWGKQRTQTQAATQFYKKNGCTNKQDIKNTYIYIYIYIYI